MRGRLGGEGNGGRLPRATLHGSVLLRWLLAGDNLAWPDGLVCGHLGGLNFKSAGLMRVVGNRGEGYSETSHRPLDCEADLNVCGSVVQVYG